MTCSRSTAQEFVACLRDVIARRPADAILLSGGLDTSIIAAVAAERARLRAITVCVDAREAVDAAHRDLLCQKLGCDADSFPAPDAAYARLAAESLRLDHEVVTVTLDELLAYAPAAIAAIGSFDPMQVRNGLTIYAGLVRASARGCRAVYTGDAADELYAGYSHMWAMAPGELQTYVEHMATIMNFTTPALARGAGVDAVSPFLDPDLVAFALRLTHDERIGEHDGRRMGKWIIREAARPLLPDALVWRVKTPIEYGSGSTFLGPLLRSRIADAEFERARREAEAETGVRLRDKEQLYFYRIFTQACGPLERGDPGPDDCPYCGAPIRPANRNYCGVCGAWGFRPRPTVAAAGPAPA
jgi:asparagine synthase (glutamine-hydrolysing)